MKIKAVVVDVGGVLVQTLDYSRRHFWEEKLHLAPGQLGKEIYKVEPADLATIGKVKDEDIWLDIKKRFELSEANLVQIKLDFSAGDRLNTGFYTFMQKVHKQYTTALLSNAWLGARESYTEKYHLDKIVDQMIISAEEGMRKPHKNIFLLTLLRLDLKPDEVLFIDDAADNIAGAKKVGIHTVQFIDTRQVIEDMTKILSKL
jgi:epoxide hydrolase-like predicted phosphatase